MFKAGDIVRPVRNFKNVLTRNTYRVYATWDREYSIGQIETPILSIKDDVGSIQVFWACHFELAKRKTKRSIGDI